MKTLNKIESKSLFHARHGWLESRFHFSFSEYFNPDNMQFGVLRVLNDDLVRPQTGFGTHPHQDMEIVSYCIDGELTHSDSMGYKETLKRGDVQYMSAGTGITHSEMNESGDKTLRFLQIWILPNKNGLTPQYGSRRFLKVDRHNRFLHVVSGKTDNEAITINQDVNIYAAEIDAGKQLEFENQENRQIYLVCIKGALAVNDVALKSRDALEIKESAKLIFKALEDSHLLMVEMAKK
ncbi:MAG: hypothetical protein IEMM0002_0548 [bacterium]|nr:MAG: hypothetical protein IEMM0002_0548 [bacterium]